MGAPDGQAEGPRPGACESVARHPAAPGASVVHDRARTARGMGTAGLGSPVATSSFGAAGRFDKVWLRHAGNHKTAIATQGCRLARPRKAGCPAGRARESARGLDQRARQHAGSPVARPHAHSRQGRPQIASTGGTLERVPPNLPNTCSRLIAMAVSFVGEAQSVALEMKCSNADFLEYCAGQKEPTMAEFDRLIGLIIREQTKLIATNRELLAKMRAAKE